MNTISQGRSLPRRSQRQGGRTLRVNNDFVVMMEGSNIAIMDFGCGHFKQFLEGGASSFQFFPKMNHKEQKH